MVDQLRGVDCIFAIVSSIMVSPGNVNFTSAYNGIKLGVYGHHAVDGSAATVSGGDEIPCVLVIRSASRDVRHGCMTGPMGVTGVWQCDGPAAALIIESLGIHPREVQIHVRVQLE